MLQLEDPEEVLFHLHQHALLQSRRLNRGHRHRQENRSIVAQGLVATRPPWYDPGVAFVRWDPLRDLLDVQQRMNRLAQGPAGWTPSVDLLETADSYVVTIELPGVTRQDIHLEVHDGRLTITGNRRERALACEQYHRIERGHGPFSRSFQLPMPIDSDRISADLKDGVLTVTCPKSSDPSARRIHIT
jgi:HSP20 family protein